MNNINGRQCILCFMCPAFRGASDMFRHVTMHEWNMAQHRNERVVNRMFFGGSFWAACLHSTTLEFAACGTRSFWLAWRIVIQVSEVYIYKIKQVTKQCYMALAYAFYSNKQNGPVAQQWRASIVPFCCLFFCCVVPPGWHLLASLAVLPGSMWRGPVSYAKQSTAP